MNHYVQEAANRAADTHEASRDAIVARDYHRRDDMIAHLRRLESAAKDAAMYARWALEAEGAA